METFDKKIQERYTNPSKYYRRISNDPLNMEYQKQRAETTGDYSEIENIYKYRRHGVNSNIDKNIDLTMIPTNWGLYENSFAPK